MKPSSTSSRNNIGMICFLLLSLSSRDAFAQKQVTNLPSFFIQTENNRPISSKSVWVKGTLSVMSRDTTENLLIPIEIRGRGNSTWGFSKKPYRIKLDKKLKLLNMPAKAKDWVLLANYADKTLMRNAVAFKAGGMLGMSFTPSYRFVDLTLNSTFLGSYLLTDQIEVGGHRVDIDKMDSTDVSSSTITGGYLLEIDGFAGSDDVYFATTNGLKITVKSPDEDVIRPQQLTYIKNFLNDFEKKLFSSNFDDPVLGYRTLVDTTSLMNWYIASELTGNSDAFWSTYIYKKRLDDRLYFGPMWDYDIAFNNDNRLGDATEKLMSKSAHEYRKWIERMLQDKWFQGAVWKRWHALADNHLLDSLNEMVNQTKSLINISEQYNFKKWNVLNSRVYLETSLFDTYGGGVDYLKTYLSKRVSFLNANLGSYIPEESNATGFSNATNSKLLVELMTNSVENQLSIRLMNTNNQHVVVSIFDLLGHRRYFSNVELEPPESLLSIPFADVGTGMFLVRISDGQHLLYMQKVIL